MQSKIKVSYSINKLLENESFVLWCLNPTSETDAYWTDYMNNNPSRADDITAARNILLSVKLNIVERRPEESDQLWLRIEKAMKRTDSKQKKMIVYRYSAAVIAFFIIVTGIWINYKTYKISHIQELHPLIVQLADSVSTEVILIRDDKNVVEIENGAIIEYDSDVTIKTQNSEKTIAKSIKERVEYNELIVPYGRRSSVVLADGSRAWLNAGSKLKFPTVFDSHERRVFVEGEVYIEVARDIDKPFFVETLNMKINVLGTKFNVSAYSDDATHTVVLLEGSVKVITDQTSNFVLSPNQRLTYNENRADIDRVDAQDYVSWKDGVFQFRSDKMDDVAQRLSRYYNIKVRCSASISNRRLSGKLVLFEDVKQVMETFSMLYDVSYKLENNEIIIE